MKNKAVQELYKQSSEEMKAAINIVLEGNPDYQQLVESYIEELDMRYSEIVEAHAKLILKKQGNSQ